MYIRYTICQYLLRIVCTFDVCANVETHHTYLFTKSVPITRIQMYNNRNKNIRVQENVDLYRTRTHVVYNMFNIYVLCTVHWRRSCGRQVQRCRKFRTPLMVTVGFRGYQWFMESNFVDFLVGDIGCLGVSTRIQPLTTIFDDVSCSMMDPVPNANCSTPCGPG